LQLHELRFAKGSPICGAEEKDNRAFWTFQSFVGLFVTGLIDENELWRPLADLEPDRWSRVAYGWAAFLTARGGKQYNGN
jgi:hypothetical protein